eukprot:6252753-Pyramimonas_sp.AAC.1
MGLVCAMEKGRSSAGGVLRVARQWGAWCLAGAVQASVRWIPSERNVADAPSRRHIPLGVWIDNGAADSAEGIEQWAIRDAGRSSQQADCRSAGLELAELAVREPAIGGLRGARRPARPAARRAAGGAAPAAERAAPEGRRGPAAPGAAGAALARGP